MKKDVLMNMTPHPVIILDGENHEVMRFESDGQIRLDSVVDRNYDPVCGVPTCRTFFRDPVGLPDREDGKFYIVSQLVKSACRDRRDLLVPSDVVRDDEGNIVGCRSLGR